MPQKLMYVVALGEMVHAGAARVAGELFEVGIVESIVLSRKGKVRRISKTEVVRHLQALRSKRRGTYERRDMVAKSY